MWCVATLSASSCLENLDSIFALTHKILDAERPDTKENETLHPFYLILIPELFTK